MKGKADNLEMIIFGSRPVKSYIMRQSLKKDL